VRGSVTSRRVRLAAPSCRRSIVTVAGTVQRRAVARVTTRAPPPAGGRGTAAGVGAQPRRTRRTPARPNASGGPPPASVTPSRPAKRTPSTPSVAQARAPETACSRPRRSGARRSATGPDRLSGDGRSTADPPPPHPATPLATSSAMAARRWAERRHRVKRPSGGGLSTSRARGAPKATVRPPAVTVAAIGWISVAAAGDDRSGSEGAQRASTDVHAAEPLTSAAPPDAGPPRR
jgi:hypothetical protein